MSRWARELLRRFLHGPSSPLSIANIFIFSLNDNFSGTGRLAICFICCWSARRFILGSLQHVITPQSIQLQGKNSKYSKSYMMWFSIADKNFLISHFIYNLDCINFMVIKANKKRVYCTHIIIIEYNCVSVGFVIDWQYHPCGYWWLQIKSTALTCKFLGLQWLQGCCLRPNCQHWTGASRAFLLHW